MPLSAGGSADEVFGKVKGIVASQLGVEETQVVPTASFTGDLGADSLDTVELIMALEEGFDVSFTTRATFFLLGVDVCRTAARMLCRLSVHHRARCSLCTVQQGTWGTKLHELSCILIVLFISLGDFSLWYVRHTFE